MKIRTLSITASLIIMSLFSMQTNAIPIMTQTAQGAYTSNALFGSRWGTFTEMMTVQHTIDEYANFENYSEISSYGAIWVDQEYQSTLSVTEIANLQKYYNSANTEALVILDSNWNDDTYGSSADNMLFAQNIVDWLADTSTNKIVLIGENGSWDGWNQSIMDIVGGGFDSNCSWDYGDSVSSHGLTSGIESVQNICGSTITAGLGNPEILFGNGMAAVYGSQGRAVPEPSVLMLLSLGLLGLAFSQRKRM